MLIYSYVSCKYIEPTLAAQITKTIYKNEKEKFLSNWKMLKMHRQYS